MITAIQYTCQVSGVSLVTGGTEKREIMADEFWFRNWPGSGRVTNQPEVGTRRIVTSGFVLADHPGVIASWLESKCEAHLPVRCSESFSGVTTNEKR
jgi:hypothetical protein